MVRAHIQWVFTLPQVLFGYSSFDGLRILLFTDPDLRDSLGPVPPRLSFYNLLNSFRVTVIQ